MKKTKYLLLLFIIASTFNLIGQTDTIKITRVSNPKNDGFLLSDFYNLIHKDTSELANIKEKYFPFPFKMTNGVRDGVCGDLATKAPLYISNPDMTLLICISNDDKIEAIQLTITNKKYVTKEDIVNQLKVGKFVKGGYSTINKILTCDYTNRKIPVYIKTKWKKEKLIELVFR